MDFRRPGEHPVEDHYHHEDGTDGVMPPVQAPETFGRPAKRNKGDIFGTIMLSILLIATTGYGVYAYMNEQQLRSDLTKAQTELSSLKDGKESAAAVAKAAEDAEKAKSDMGDKAQQSRATYAASQYYCLIKDFGCDKVISSVTKLQVAKVSEDAALDQDGFAIITATPTNNGASVKFYVKSKNGLDWVVIFDGQNTPSTEIADRFEIPTSFR